MPPEETKQLISEWAALKEQWPLNNKEDLIWDSLGETIGGRFVIVCPSSAEVAEVSLTMALDSITAAARRELADWAIKNNVSIEMCFPISSDLVYDLDGVQEEATGNAVSFDIHEKSYEAVVLAAWKKVFREKGIKNDYQRL